MQCSRRIVAGLSLVILIGALPVQAQANEITRLVLINADTDKPLGELTAGRIVDLAKLGGNLNVRAEVAGEVGSVRFALMTRTTSARKARLPSPWPATTRATTEPGRRRRGNTRSSPHLLQGLAPGRAGPETGC